MNEKRSELPDESGARLAEQSGAALREDGAEPNPVAGRVPRPGDVLAGGRLRLVRYIGRGGMGTVYEAEDTLRRSPVALKVLTQADGDGIYALKNEFRSLVNVHHKNLVELHELFSERDLWFFTMELIHGQHFDTWVRPGDELDVARLRPALLQLVDGISALHAARKLHRDLKPSNVLVTPLGSVHVLDFGLVADRQDAGQGQTMTEEHVAGTPLYMAPEQATGHVATAATDVYALGVILYRALTGGFPFLGVGAQVLVDKLQREAPEIAPGGAPPDLAELCMQMLLRDPDGRPSLGEVRERLGATVGASGAVEAVDVERPSLLPGDLVGRDAELDALQRAYEETLDDRTVVVSVTGDSGIGKSALCEAFLGRLRAGGGVRVLPGRCYERERVPYKAVDALVDRLSRTLNKLPKEEAAAVLPRDAFALAMLFPVLGRVDAIAGAPSRVGLNPREVQRRGFEALAEMLTRIRDRSPLVVYLDDLQWTDLDSVALLRHLLLQSDPVPALFVFSHRGGEGAESGELVTSILDAARGNPSIRLRRLRVGPLAQRTTEQLAERLLAGNAASRLHAEIAREAGGSPFFLGQLARAARVRPEQRGRLSLSSVVATRLAELSAVSQRLIKALALAGRPLPVEVMCKVSDATDSDVDALSGAQLLRGSQEGSERLVDCYHDRIRELVRQSLAEEERRDLYDALARVLSERKAADPELLSRCLDGAGKLDLAGEFAVLAAEQANTAMAFEQAARCYRKALDLTGSGVGRRKDLLAWLGVALENGGHGKEAAERFQQAAALTEGEERTELLRGAAEQLLATGYVAEGRRLLAEVCRDVRLDLATTESIPSLVYNHVRLRFRRLSPATRVEPLSSSGRLRVRAAHTSVTGLIGYSPIQAAIMAARYLDLALDTGDTAACVRSMALNAFLAGNLDPAGSRATVLLSRATGLAKQDGGAELLGFTWLVQGSIAFFREHFRTAREHFAQAKLLLRGCTGVEWEIDSTNLLDQLAAHYCGDYRELARTIPPLVEEASRRGRVWTIAMLSGLASLSAWLTRDDPDGYRRQLSEAKTRWTPQDIPLMPDFMLVVGEAMLGVYEGEPDRALETFLNRHATLSRSLLLRRGGARDVYYAHLGRCAAGALRIDPSRNDARAASKESIAALRRRGGPATSAVVDGILAAEALGHADHERGVALLRSSVAHWGDTDSAMLGAAAKRRLGQLVGGEDGGRMVADAEAVMRAQGVKDVERMTEVNCPGCTPP